MTTRLEQELYEELHRKVIELEQALDWYAQEENWWYYNRKCDPRAAVYLDIGARARKALGRDA